MFSSDNEEQKAKTLSSSNTLVDNGTLSNEEPRRKEISASFPEKRAGRFEVASERPYANNMLHSGQCHAPVRFVPTPSHHSLACSPPPLAHSLPSQLNRPAVAADSRSYICPESAFKFLSRALAGCQRSLAARHLAATPGAPSQPE